MSSPRTFPSSRRYLSPRRCSEDRPCAQALEQRYVRMMSGVQREASREVLAQRGIVSESAVHHEGIRLQRDVDVGESGRCGLRADVMAEVLAL